MADNHDGMDLKIVTKGTTYYKVWVPKKKDSNTNNTNNK